MTEELYPSPISCAITPIVNVLCFRSERAKKVGRLSSFLAAAIMRSRVGLGMCLADGASLRPAETVPADSPTWAATAFSVTVLPFESSVFFFSAIVLMIQDDIG